MDLGGQKYKDELPIKTINKARELLGRLGLLTVEKVWRNSVKGFHSVSIIIENTDIITNGKGTSPEYALASAYGEMMERLQNQATYRLSLDLSQETLEYKGFYYAPDEKAVSIDDFLTGKDEWVATQLAKLDKAVDQQELLKKWQEVSYEEVPADFIALPYCNLVTKNISHIPMKMISKMYMSNGMCAGNTPEEAIVQGIAEILERYANKRILRDRMVPPTVPRRAIAGYPNIEAMIAGIEASGDFEIVVKDCSLEENIPVVGVVFINKSNQSYFVKFGAHPKIEMALERTLTELLQGQDIRKMMGMQEFSYHCAENNPDNYMGILVTGSGVYPSEFFSRTFSYPFLGFKEVNLANNKEMLAHMVELLVESGYQTYVRDVSFLGFNSYHVVIPGLSEIEELDDIRAITDYADYNQFKRLVRQMDRVDSGKADALIKLLEKMSYPKDASVMDTINLPFRGIEMPWYYSKMGLFITALYYYSGDLAKAYGTFSEFLLFTQQHTSHQGIITYYKCVRDYLGTMLDGLSEKQAVSTLSMFYSHDVIHGVVNEFGSPSKIFSQGHLGCWNCKHCRFSGQCLYPSMEQVYKLLKDRYAACNINQTHLKELI